MELHSPWHQPAGLMRTPLCCTTKKATHCGIQIEKVLRASRGNTSAGFYPNSRLMTLAGEIGLSGIPIRRSSNKGRYPTRWQRQMNSKHVYRLVYWASSPPGHQFRKERPGKGCQPRTIVSVSDMSDGFGLGRIGMDGG